MRRWIAGSLTIGGLLLAVTLVAGLLWALLSAVGDNQAAVAARTVALVVFVCWWFDFVILVVLLAAAYLAESAEEGESTEE